MSCVTLWPLDHEVRYAAAALWALNPGNSVPEMGEPNALSSFPYFLYLFSLIEPLLSDRVYRLLLNLLFISLCG
jgi:hypothetical protein